MSSKQFEQIKRMLCLVSNDTVKHRSNKVVKVAPLYNSLNNVCDFFKGKQKVTLSISQIYVICQALINCMLFHIHEK